MFCCEVSPLQPTTLHLILVESLMEVICHSSSRVESSHFKFTLLSFLSFFCFQQNLLLSLLLLITTAVPDFSALRDDFWVLKYGNFIIQSHFLHSFGPGKVVALFKSYHSHRIYWSVIESTGFLMWTLIKSLLVVWLLFSISN